MPNIFLCIAWPLIIFLTIKAYRISKKKFKPIIAVAIAGMTGIVAVFVSANAIRVLYVFGEGFEIGDIFKNLIYLVKPYLAQ